MYVQKRTRLTLVKNKKMSDRLCKNLPLLKLLYKASPGQRSVILQSASDQLILALCEIALNVLRETIPLNNSQFRRLKKRREEIKYTASKKINVERKKLMINQKGGFLVPLLSVAIPFITSLITSRQH